MRVRRPFPLPDPTTRGFSERTLLFGLLLLGAIVMLLVSATDLRHLLVGGVPPDATG